jgi:hypothetical protein
VREPGPVRVITVLSEAIYLQHANGRLIALGPAEAMPGPLNAHVAADATVRLSPLKRHMRHPTIEALAMAGLAGPNARGRIYDEHMTFAAAQLDCRRARHWYGSCHRTKAAHGVVQAGLERFDQVMHDLCARNLVEGPLTWVSEPPRGGLQSAFTDRATLPAAREIWDILETAAPALESWLQGFQAGSFEPATPSGTVSSRCGNSRTGAVPASLNRLVGLGPGLTPAGDDILAGMLLGLRCFGYPSAADELAEHLNPLLSSHTNTISAAHMVAAGDGQASRALHDVLRDWVLRDWRNLDLTRLASSVRTALSIGHSSGADALLGIRTAAAAVVAISAATRHDSATVRHSATIQDSATIREGHPIRINEDTVAQC